jgi:hypothetical protein
MKYRQFIIERASAALLMGVNDPEALRYIFPSAGMAWEGAQYLREHRLSIFAEDIEKPHLLNRGPTIASQGGCAGSVDKVEVVCENPARVLKISGWAWDRQHARPPEEIIAAGSGVNSGRFAVGEWRPQDRASNPGVTNSYIGYTGYVREDDALGTVQLYVVLHGRPGSACPFAAVKSSGQR